MPRVSVVLPVRDAADHLEACLASLAAQTLADHEVIAVDDGSVDASPGILASFGDERLRVVTQRRLGLVAALNAGLAVARSDLVARMDADDVAHPERLEIQAERLSNDPAIDVLASRVRLIGGVPGGNTGMQAYVAWSNALLDHRAIVSDIFVESPLVHPSVTARAGLLRALGGYRDPDGPEDYDLWLRALASGAHFAKTPEVLLDWRDRPERLTRTDPRYGLARFRERKLEALLELLLPEGRSVVVWGAGPIGKEWARSLAGKGRRVAAFVDVDPRKIGQTIHGAPVVSVGAVAGLAPALHLAAVGDPDARRRIRRAAAELGLADGRDLVAVA
jgi:glycosyltransferase involved in cell wall biosynthesis